MPRRTRHHLCAIRIELAMREVDANVRQEGPFIARKLIERADTTPATRATTTAT
jgi:hypothetical protein